MAAAGEETFAFSADISQLMSLIINSERGAATAAAAAAVAPPRRAAARARARAKAALARSRASGEILPPRAGR